MSWRPALGRSEKKETTERFQNQSGFGHSFGSGNHCNKSNQIKCKDKKGRHLEESLHSREDRAQLDFLKHPFQILRHFHAIYR
jgi:hypothetical protein